MASWLTHLRIADRLFDSIKISDEPLFYAGSIAPDTSLSPELTHWCVNGDKTTCNAEQFYRQYLHGIVSSNDEDFYLGYYVHLLTDVLWQKEKIMPLKQYGGNAIKKAKDGWNKADRSFLYANENFRPFCVMRNTEKFRKQWFDFYSMNQVSELVEKLLNTCNFTSNENIYMDLAPKLELAQFVDCASINILSKMHKQGMRFLILS